MERIPVTLTRSTWNVVRRAIASDPQLCPTSTLRSCGHEHCNRLYGAFLEIMIATRTPPVVGHAPGDAET